MNQQLSLRLETSADHEIVEHITREAFWNVNVPGCDEHYLVHLLRKSPAFIPELNYVALLNGEVVGNIMYAHTKIVDSNECIIPIVTFGPVTVVPEHQGKGIGKALIRHTLGLAKEMGHRVVATYGDPDYYCRFGFEAGELYGIRGSDGLFSPALIVLELVPGALQGINGRFYEGDAYQLDPVAAEQYDRKFPPKEKFETPSQKRFLELLSQSHP
jgi:predicted N-acetyltransferase YhbS